MQQNLSGRGGVAPVSTALQLTLSHLLAVGGALGVFYGTQWLGFSIVGSLLLAALAGGLSGLLLTSNLLYDLYVLELTLRGLTRGQQLEDRSPRRHWPLTSLVEQVNRLSQRIQEYRQGAVQSEEMREQALQQAREIAAREERDRIARDLHDSIKQQIFSISVSAAAARAYLQGDVTSAQEAVVDIQRSAKEAQVEMQALLQQLRPAPLEHTHLTEALRIQGEALSYRTGAEVQAEIEGLPEPELFQPGSQEAIFRIMQEIFANIARHARATRIVYRLACEGNYLQIEVCDDGQGFDPASAKTGMGLTNLKTRVAGLKGTLEIESAPGQGTVIRAKLPLMTALSTPEEQQLLALEIKTASEQAHRGYQLTENAAPIAFVLIGVVSQVAVPWFVIVLCVLAALWGYIQGYYYLVRININLGRDHVDAVALQLHDAVTRMELVRLLGFSAWYGFYLFQGWRPGNLWSWWLLVVGWLALMILAYFERLRRYQIIDHYYSLISGQELGWELNQQQRRSVRLVRIWLLIVGAIIFINWGRVYLVFPPRTPLDLTGYIVILGLLIWGQAILVGFRHRQRWSATLAKRVQVGAT